MKPANPLRKADYLVKDVELALARQLVEKYHYAHGGSNTRVYTHGLFARREPLECLGVAWWLPPTRRAAETVSADWRSVLCLTRLVIVPGVPTNGATFLLGASIRIIRHDPRWRALVTYADEGQGHTGAIYRASNFEYVGKRPATKVWMDADGRHVSRKAGPVSRTVAEMMALGYVSTGKTHKHKFVLRLDPTSALERAA